MGFKNNVKDRYQAIPEELKRHNNWVCYKAVPDERSHSGVSKKPIDAKNGEYARSNDPSTWTDFETAVSASEKFSGIGFMFGDSPYFGVDLDDMPDEIHDYKCGGSGGRAGEFMSVLQSYCELSQSGKGLHIICKGTLPVGGKRKGQIEMYESGRFFVMTGKPFGSFTSVRDCTEDIKPLHRKYIQSETRPVQIDPSPITPSDMSVNEILELALNAKNGEKFARLMSGDISDYGSQSEADMAFCNMLAFWTGRNAEKMDSIFRSSGLMREKWDRRQSGTTYGALTIGKAVASCTETYSPKEKRTTPKAQNDDSQQDTAPAQVKRYTMDDTGNAERFVDLFGDKIRYCYTDKRWYYYDGKRWCTDYSGTAMRLTDGAIEAMKLELKDYLAEGGEESDMYKSFKKHVKTSRSHKSKENMLKEVQHNVPLMPKQLDRRKFALNTPNGVIDLKTGKLYAHKAEYYLSKITETEIGNSADCPLWERFLDEIFEGDKDLIRYVQKAVGYTLTGETVEQCAFFLYGTGRNGKSTFIDIIREIMGSYAANIQPESLMVKSSAGSAINSDIARLKGARLVTSVEPNEGVRLNEGLIKQLTGDDTVTARKLYGEEFEFKPEFKLWMATNHKPTIRGTDTGIWRRIHLIPFNACIPLEKVDKDLKQKLRSELPQIFRWALDGCLLWQKEGLRQPASVMDAVREYRREMDVITAFIEDKCELSGAEQSSLLYAAYSQWAEDNNEYRMSATKFSLEMSKRFEKVKARNSNFFNGISLSKSY